MKPDVIVGPDRIGYRSIFCRSCAPREVSRRVDGTWRHDDDGTVVERLPDGTGCTDPDTLWAEADARTAQRAAAGNDAPVNPDRYADVDAIVDANQALRRSLTPKENA